MRVLLISVALLSISASGCATRRHINRIYNERADLMNARHVRELAALNREAEELFASTSEPLVLETEPAYSALKACVELATKDSDMLKICVDNATKESKEGRRRRYFAATDPKELFEHMRASGKATIPPKIAAIVDVAGGFGPLVEAIIWEQALQAQHNMNLPAVVEAARQGVLERQREEVLALKAERHQAVNEAIRTDLQQWQAIGNAAQSYDTQRRLERLESQQQYQQTQQQGSSRIINPGWR